MIYALKKEGSHEHYSEASSEDERGFDEQILRRKSEQCRYNGRGATIHLVLLLERTERELKRFRRVGMGMVSSPSWSQGTDVEDVVLI